MTSRSNRGRNLPAIKKRIIFASIGLIIVIAILAGIKALQIGAMINHGKKFVAPPETITSTAVRAEAWGSDLAAVGTLTAVQGVTVACELAGKVVRIAFESGAFVRKGDLLVGQDISSEESQLPGALAQAKLARSNLQRDVKMLAEKIISQADYDAALAAREQALAQVNTIRAAIGKKTTRPFQRTSRHQAGEPGPDAAGRGSGGHPAGPEPDLRRLRPPPAAALPVALRPAGAGYLRRPPRPHQCRNRHGAEPPWWTPKPAISSFRRPWKTGRRSLGPGCSST